MMRFTPEKNMLCDNWFRLVQFSNDCKWEETGCKFGANFQVRCGDLLGVAKPAKDGANCEAAHEKLAFDQGIKWNAAFEKARAIPKIRSVMSQMIAFHIWINDGNRETPGHILVNSESPDDDSLVAFYDHGGSMQDRWLDSLASDCYFPTSWTRDTEAIMETAARINSFDCVSLCDLARRIPTDYWPAPDREYVLHKLLIRKDDIHRLIECQARAFNWDD